MSDHPYKYMLQVTAGTHRVNSEKVEKNDLEQVRTEASMVAEILGQQVTIYSVPTFGTAQWQILERVDPPPGKENEDEDK